MIPCSTSSPNGTFGKFFLPLFKLIISSLRILVCRSRFFERLIYFLFSSIPIKLRCNFFATAAVVPEPRKGSKTKSPFFEEDKRIR